MTAGVHDPRFDDLSLLEVELMRARVTAGVLKRPPPTPRIGQFALLRKLGAGTTGAVYEARSTRSGAEVALKLLRAQDSCAVQRFKREFRSLAHVAHPNLVQLYELFCGTDEWYFTMELIRGTAFTQHVRGALGSSRAAQLARLRATLAQVLAGVKAIHASGCLHCDLKPANVLVSELGRVVVLDFGLATALTERVAGGEIRPPGTPAYMAPELKAGYAPPSVASDAYAIGVMLFEALTGQRPTDCETRAGDARCGRPAPRASRLIADTPADLDELCARLLAHDRGARPSLDEALAFMHLSATPLRAGLPREQGTAWVGRQAELEAMHAAFAQLSLAAPVAVFVKGKSGIGKSALLARFAAELGPRATVLRAACYERESVPYKAFDGLVDALLTPLSSLSPQQLHAMSASEAKALLRVFGQLAGVSALRQRAAGASSPVGQQELRRQAFSALKWLLRALAEDAPLVLVVDDLQWADLDSAQLLRELLGPPHAPALLYVGAYRDGEEERSEFLRMLNAREGSPQLACQSLRVTLQPLEKTAAEAMARMLLPPSRLASGMDERIAREAEGVPLFVAELAAYLADEVRAAEGACPSLSTLLMHRFAALDPTERKALCLAAIAARPLDTELLDCALGGGPAGRSARHVLLAQALLLTNAQGQLVIYHDRLREHLAQSLTSSEAAECHRSLAQAYDRLQAGEPEWLIAHWRAAGDHVRARACAIAAAELAVAKLAFHRGAALYRTALALAPDGGPSDDALSAALGDVLVSAGRGVEAADAYLQAAQTSLDNAFAWRCRAAQQLLRSGRKARGVALLRQLLREAGYRYPESTAAIGVKWLSSRSRLAVHKWFGVSPRREHDVNAKRRLQVLGAAFRECAVVDPARSLLFQSQFLEEALRAGDPESVFMGLAWDAYSRAFTSKPQRSRTMALRLEQLDRLARELDTPYAMATTTFVRATASLAAGRYVDAVEQSARAIEIFRDRCLGALWEETFCTLVHTAALDNVGPLTGLCEQGPGLVRRANERADQLADALLSTPMATVLLAQDRPAQAESFLHERESGLAREMDLQRLGITLKMADVLIYVGDGPAAQETMERAWTGYLRSGFDFTFMRMFVRMRRAHAALVTSLARPSKALHRIALAEAARIARMRRDDATVIAQGIRGAVAYQRGNREEACGLLREAVALVEPMGATITASCYRLQLGRITVGPRGRALVESAEAALRAQGIVNPVRFASIYVSGL